MAKHTKQRSSEILGGLDEPARAADLADWAAYSEPQFFRRAKRELGEPPMGARRRLLLERAAYRLTRTRQAITEIAFDASFESLEGFGRAFKKAFGVSPSSYRKLKADEFRIDLSERIHYAPPPASSVDARQGDTMKVTELMTEHHVWQVAQFLEACSGFTDDQLDATMDSVEPFPWHCPRVTLREMLARATAFAAPWMAAINGVEVDYQPSEVADMRVALTFNRDGFFDILRAVESDNSYDLTFVDSTCEPPEVFSYGWVIAHVLTHSIQRRMAISRHLHALGVRFEERLDPSQFERIES